MGLMQHARMATNRLSAQPPQKKSGLLDRVQNHSSYDSLTDSLWLFLRTAGFERGGILYPSDEGLSVFLLSTGMDLTTARRFSPDSATLSCVSSGNEWREFSQASLDPFLACFSSRERDSLVSLWAYPVALNGGIAALIILVDSKLDVKRDKKTPSKLPSETERMIDAIRENQAVLSYLSRVNQPKMTSESIQDRIRCSIEAGKTANLVSVSMERVFTSPESIATDAQKNELFTAFARQIGRQAGSSNIVRTTSSFSLAIVLFSSAPLDIDLYFRQILKPLEPIFGVGRVSGIAVETAGTETDPVKISKYLFREN
jgi:hypothetical protein